MMHDQRYSTIILGLLTTGLYLVFGSVADAKIQSSWGKNFDEWYEYAVQAHAQGNFEESVAVVTEDTVNKKVPKNDIILWLLEKGKILQDAGLFKESLETLDEANQLLEEEYIKEEESITAGITSLLFGKDRTPYRGSYSERIMVNMYQAINCIALGDFENARVYCRNVENRQEQSLIRYKKDEEKQFKLLEEKQIDLSLFTSPEYEEYAKNIDAMASSSYADYENPIATYIYALTFKPEDMATSQSHLESVQVIFPENRYINEALTGEKWEADAPAVYVIHELGMAPVREEIHIPIPSKASGISALELVTLKRLPPDIQNLSTDGTGQTSLESIGSIDGIVATEFKHTSESMRITAILNALAQEAAAQEAGKKNQLLGLLTKKTTEAIYKPDLRGWRTIGSEFQVAHLARPDDGVLRLNKHDASGAKREAVSVQLPETHQCIVYIRSVNMAHSTINAFPLAGDEIK